MLYPFDNDCEIAPRTYNIIGYSRKNGISIKKLFMAIAYLVVALIALIIALIIFSI